MLASIGLLGLFAGGATWALQAAADGSGMDAAGAPQALTDDDGGRPLFTVSRMTPGQTVVRCVRVSHEGPEDIPISIAGASAGGPLAGLVDLQIDTGPTGRTPDCDGFSGTALFRGTLAEFEARSASAEGSIIAWTSRTRVRERVFRFTVGLRDSQAAEGASTELAFTWGAADRPLPPAGGSSLPPVTADPKVVAVVTEPRRRTTGSSVDREPNVAGPVATAPDAAARSADESVRGPRVAAVRPGRAAARDGAPARRATIARAAPAREDPAVGPSLVRQVVEAAGDVAVRAAFPLLLAILAGLFLLVQHRLDARDPKLALAPVTRDPDLPFGPVPPPGEPTT